MYNRQRGIDSHIIHRRVPFEANDNFKSNRVLSKFSTWFTVCNYNGGSPTAPHSIYGGDQMDDWTAAHAQVTDTTVGSSGDIILNRIGFGYNHGSTSVVNAMRYGSTTECLPAGMFSFRERYQYMRVKKVRLTVRVTNNTAVYNANPTKIYCQIYRNDLGIPAWGTGDATTRGTQPAYIPNMYSFYWYPPSGVENNAVAKSVQRSFDVNIPALFNDVEWENDGMADASPNFWIDVADNWGTAPNAQARLRIYAKSDNVHSTADQDSFFVDVGLEWLCEFDRGIQLGQRNTVDGGEIN